MNRVLQACLDRDEDKLYTEQQLRYRPWMREVRQAYRLLVDDKYFPDYKQLLFLTNYLKKRNLLKQVGEVYIPNILVDVRLKDINSKLYSYQTAGEFNYDMVYDFPIDFTSDEVGGLDRKRLIAREVLSNLDVKPYEQVSYFYYVCYLPIDKKHVQLAAKAMAALSKTLLKATSKQLAETFFQLLNSLKYNKKSLTGVPLLALFFKHYDQIKRMLNSLTKQHISANLCDIGELKVVLQHLTRFGYSAGLLNFISCLGDALGKAGFGPVRLAFYRQVNKVLNRSDISERSAVSANVKNLKKQISFYLEESKGKETRPSEKKDASKDGEARPKEIKEVSKEGDARPSAQKEVNKEPSDSVVAESPKKDWMKEYCYDNYVFDLREQYSQKGLPNLGNTCYINSVMILLSSAREVFVQLDRRAKQNSLLEIVQKLYQQLNYKYAGGYYLKQAYNRLLDAVRGKFVLGEQQDALEFFYFLMDSLNTAAKAVNKDIGLETAFEVGCKYEYQCSEGHSQTIDESAWTLPLGFRAGQQGVSLQILIDEHLKEGIQGFLCEKCSRQMKLKGGLYDRRPQFLVVMLMRFKYNSKSKGKEKLLDQVRLESRVSLGGKEYRLQGVLAHLGETTQSGHYMTYRLVGSRDRWLLYNDDFVCEVQFRKAADHNQLFNGTETPYLVLYRAAARKGP